jgi:hypothetical protein
LNFKFQKPRTEDRGLLTKSNTLTIPVYRPFIKYLHQVERPPRSHEASRTESYSTNLQMDTTRLVDIYFDHKG